MEDKVDILIPSKDRFSSLKRCLKSIYDCEYLFNKAITLTIIDNSQKKENNALYRQIAEEYSVNYLQEEKIGLCNALNAGIKNTQNPIIVFLDDDTIVQPEWLKNLIAPLENKNIVYVSGKVIPYKIETYAEKLFEMKGGLDKQHKELVVFNMKIFEEKYPFRFPPIFFVALGANSAVKRFVIEDVGGFDSNYGLGGYIGAGNMGEFCCRLIFHNYTLAHNPEAIICHCHREDLNDLYDIRFRYAQADTAIMMKFFHNYRSLKGLFTAFFYHPWKRLFQGILIKDYPLKLVLIEFVGNWLGIIKYFNIMRKRG